MLSPYEVAIPSDSEEEEEEMSLVWREKSEEPISRRRLILTLGVLPSKAVECAIQQEFVTRSKWGCLRDVATQRDVTFELVETKNDSFLWARVPKSFDGKSNVLLADELIALKFDRIDVLEAHASQLNCIPPGVYKLTSDNYPKLSISNYPVGFAAQGVSGSLLTRCILNGDATIIGAISLFTESLRTPQLEDLQQFDPVIPKIFITPSRQTNLTRFTCVDKFKDNIYV